MVSFPKISPNLLLGVGGVIAAVFLVSQIRKAGADVQDALTDIKLPDIKLPDITLPTINFPDIKLPSLPDVSLPTVTLPIISLPDILTDLFPSTPSAPLPPDVKDTGLLSQEEILACKCGSSIIQDIQGDVQQVCLECPPEATQEPFVKTAAELAEEQAFLRTLDTPIPPPVIPTPTPTVVSLLPEPQQFQAFAAEGSPAVEFTIRENPIDTLSEVIDFFPELTASQAADFLLATEGKILPSQVEAGLIDPDIRNIVAGFVGGGQEQAIPVSQTPLEIDEIRAAENLKAAEFTCREFGLNCELVNGMMA